MDLKEDLKEVLAAFSVCQDGYEYVLDEAIEKLENNINGHINRTVEMKLVEPFKLKLLI